MKQVLRAAVAVLNLAVAMEAKAQCTADLTSNGIVDGADLSHLLAYWGPRTQDPSSIASDLNGDARVDGGDLSILLANWGPCQSTITSITPNQGCIVGGTQVTISGAYLGSTSAVTFGGTAATNFTVLNQRTVQATTPASILGPADVRMTTAAGTILAPQQFIYMPASISGITPSFGLPAGGTKITITGAYLALTSGVTIGGSPCTNLTVLNANTITFDTPPGSLGNADVVIAGGKGTVTVPGGYRYVSIVVPSWATLVEAQPDPGIVTNPALRAAIMATGLAWRVRDTGTQVEMLLVPPGTFQMGCAMASNSYWCPWQELPVHQVNLTDAFYLGRCEVTQAQWQSTMATNPSSFLSASAQVPESEVSNRPVEQVSWNAVQGYLAATGMRLPTEAEWEYACRAATQTPFYNGSTDDGTLADIAWYLVNSDRQTHPVGGKNANGFGFSDMLGNASEWVSDGYGEYVADPQADPTGSAGSLFRVLRGGCWSNGSGNVRSSDRSCAFPGSASDGFGFRVARNP